MLAHFHANFTDAELVKLDEQVVAHMPPERVQALAPLFFRACNVDDLSAQLASVKARHTRTRLDCTQPDRHRHRHTDRDTHTTHSDTHHLQATTPAVRGDALRRHHHRARRHGGDPQAPRSSSSCAAINQQKRSVRAITRLALGYCLGY